MKHRYATLFIPIFGILFFACASPPVQQWRSTPEVLTTSDKSVNIKVAPFKESHPYFVGFELTIQNKTRAPIEIDWNQTQYLHNGKDLGVFIYAGIDPKTIKDAIPPDQIAPGATFSKQLFPLRTIAFLPRSEVPESGRLGFMPGLLPSGDNSMRLVMTQGDQTITHLLTVRFRADSASQ